MSVPQSAINLYEALLLDPSGQDQDACSFRVTHRNPAGNHEDIWDPLKRMPVENKCFMTSMKFFGKRPAHGAMHLVNGYDWSASQGQLVVDVSRPRWADPLRSRSTHVSLALLSGRYLPYSPISMPIKALLQCGGSTGHVAAAIGKRYPSLTIISQDLPMVIKQTQLTQSTLPPNVSLAVHDFSSPNRFSPPPTCSD
jgi:hypothetical protein